MKFTTIETIETLEQMQQMAKAGKLVGLFKVSNFIYHRGPGISKTHLPYILRSIKHYEQYLKDGSTSTPAKILGSLLHTMLLEPNELWNHFAEKLQHGKRSKADKEAWAAFEEENTRLGKEVIDQEQRDLVDAMIGVINHHPNAPKLMHGHKEIACFWKDPVTGLLCKCKHDVIGFVTGISTDIKKTRIAAPDANGFIRAAHEFTFNIQNAFYLDGIKYAVEQSGMAIDFKVPEKMVFMAIEETAPHAMCLCELPEDFIENGREKYQKALKRLQDYNDLRFSEDFEGIKAMESYPTGIIKLPVKGYMYQ